ncbi:hypothetical protein Pmani_024155 [Petrolisthes manimaculis]|uniref:Uncharacterized protein n=1 Tax=Petrolisthes manimaculis TaxID=1843537 RepID=A0AAE1TZL7_9EUCA|nr:hypothetical protein Pmani_024155 [Petrolisthes manimaculis]
MPVSPSQDTQAIAGLVIKETRRRKGRLRCWRSRRRHPGRVTPLSASVCVCVCRWVPEEDKKDGPRAVKHSSSTPPSQPTRRAAHTNNNQPPSTLGTMDDD